MSTREMIVSEATLRCNSGGVEQQADLFVDHTAKREKKPAIVMHDKDSKGFP